MPLGGSKLGTPLITSSIINSSKSTSPLDVQPKVGNEIYLMWNWISCKAAVCKISIFFLLQQGRGLGVASVAKPSSVARGVEGVELV